MVVIPKQAGADDSDEQQIPLTAGHNEQVVGEDTGGKNEEAPQTADTQQIPHNLLHVRLADACSVRHHQRGGLACAESTWTIVRQLPRWMVSMDSSDKALTISWHKHALRVLTGTTRNSTSAREGRQDGSVGPESAETSSCNISKLAKARIADSRLRHQDTSIFSQGREDQEMFDTVFSRHCWWTTSWHLRSTTMVDAPDAQSARAICTMLWKPKSLQIMYAALMHRRKRNAVTARAPEGRRLEV